MVVLPNLPILYLPFKQRGYFEIDFCLYFGSDECIDFKCVNL